MSSSLKHPPPQLDAKALGSALAARRVRAQLSQEDVAEILGIGQEAVSRLERGVVVPSLQRLFEFANAYGCGVDEFILPVSAIPKDQAVWLSKRLGSLLPADREFVVEMVDKICDRFKR
ncbi:helix-turn-helix domain-containing protein [Xylophilus sp. Leaf220]|uniref:helix-turn-helix domain-containing protein n=1 Tax=Xylophilus sp. Leaf220 TaxID=1735686 RepID=UPI001443F81A|nr:helix-turn-helix transcriptional regulator [Xylophilus sp. Leaf220]